MSSYVLVCTVLEEFDDVQGFTAVKRPRDARLGSGEKIAKDDALTKLGSKKSLLASPAASAKSSPSAVLPRPSIDPTMPGMHQGCHSI